MTDWFIVHRTEWIREIIEVYGYINREHVEKKFGVSTPQASQDLQRAVEQYPDIVYNKVSKRYEYQP